MFPRTQTQIPEEVQIYNLAKAYHYHYDLIYSGKINAANMHRFAKYMEDLRTRFQRLTNNYNDKYIHTYIKIHVTMESSRDKEMTICNKISLSSQEEEVPTCNRILDNNAIHKICDKHAFEITDDVQEEDAMSLAICDQHAFEITDDVQEEDGMSLAICDQHTFEITDEVQEEETMSLAMQCLQTSTFLVSDNGILTEEERNSRLDELQDIGLDKHYLSENCKQLYSPYSKIMKKCDVDIDCCFSLNEKKFKEKMAGKHKLMQALLCNFARHTSLETPLELKFFLRRRNHYYSHLPHNDRFLLDCDVEKHFYEVFHHTDFLFKQSNSSPYGFNIFPCNTLMELDRSELEKHFAKRCSLHELKKIVDNFKEDSIIAAPFQHLQLITTLWSQYNYRGLLKSCFKVKDPVDFVNERFKDCWKLQSKYDCIYSTSLLSKL